MVNPTYPGVYIVEEPSAVHTITAVATSITAFLGRTRQGPVNKAVRIHSLSDFYKTFGEPFKDSQLGISVQLFFQNGGSDCYIVRLTGAGGDYASIILKNEDKLDVLKFTAKESGVWGNEVALQIDYDTPLPEDTFNLRIYRIANDGTIVTNEEFLDCSMDPDDPKFSPQFISQSSDLLDCECLVTDYTTNPCYSESRYPIPNLTTHSWIDKLRDILNGSSTTTKLQISIEDVNGISPFVEVDLLNVIDASVSDELGVEDRINTKINTLPTLKDKIQVLVQDGPGSPGDTKLIRFTPTTTHQQIKSVKIRPGLSNDVTRILMLGTENGGIERSSPGNFRPSPNGIFFDLSNLNTLANQTQDFFNKVILDQTPLDLTSNDGKSKLETTNPPPGSAHKWYEDKNGLFDGVREKFKIISAEINSEFSDWNAKVAGSRLLLSKKMPNRNYVLDTISTTPHDIGNYFKKNAMVYSLGVSSGEFTGTNTEGKDGGMPEYKHYIGEQDKHTGFYALDLVDIFNLMVIPRDSNLKEENYLDLWAPASTYCKDHRAFLLVEPPDTWKSKSDALDQTSGIRRIRRGVVKDHSAVFYPKLVVINNGVKTKVNPGGAIAGIMARTDAQVGVWKAPAGLDADIQGGNYDLDILLTDLENGDLNQQGINCLRLFPSGIITWGARTMDGADDFGSSWKYIPIRRLALMIEESLYRGTQWVVFQPNDEPLWAKIRLNVGSFMMQLFRKGAFQGGTPDKAFFVKCDGETTTQADRDLGIVNIIVGFAPLKPAEFVIITIRQIQGDL